MSLEHFNILHVSTPRTWRGGEQQMVYLINELEKRGVKQHLVCPENSAVDNYFKNSNINVYSVKPSLSLCPQFANQIAKICKENEIDIIHTHDSGAHTHAILATTIFGNTVPVVVSRRVDFPIKNSILSIWKYNHPIVKKILCVSETIKQITGNRIKNKEVLETVYSGIDLDKFKNSFPVKGKLRKEFNIPKEKIIIGNVSAIAPHKDYITFINTAELLLKERNDLHFIIIGDGPLFNDIRDFIKRKGLNSKITMTGFRNDIPDILPELDLFLFTSETEGLGTSLLDAFACKVPIVATPAGGATELIKDGETGVLGEIKNPKSLVSAVSLLLKNEPLRSKIVAGGLQHLNNFTKEFTAKKTLEVYSNIIG